jgi:hypothetical protein
MPGQHEALLQIHRSHTSPIRSRPFYVASARRGRQRDGATYRMSFLASAVLGPPQWRFYRLIALTGCKSLSILDEVVR